MTPSSNGIKPYNLASWRLSPGRTALVVIDMQNDFLSEQGWYATSGVDIAQMRQSIEPVCELVTAARAHNVPVIWTQHGFRDATDGGVFMSLRDFLSGAKMIQISWASL